MKIIRILVFAACFAPALVVPAHARDAQGALEERIRQILHEEGLTGAAWAIVAAGGEIRTGAAGYADSVSRAPFSASARFHVGSVAKLVLATGVLRLVSEGRIDLDHPVTQYLPGLAFQNPWADSDPVTVRHLLDHTSGLDDTRLWQMFSERPTPDTPLIEAFTRDPDVLRVRSRPGSRLSYSNMGYGLLGLVIESVTAMRYEDYLDAHLLAPLGMRDSTFRYTTQVGDQADARLVWGHLDDGARHPATPVMLRPAAQFTTTAHDLAVLARFLMSDGTLDGAVFIRPDLMRARGHAVTTEAARAGLQAGYALGVARRDRYGVIGYCHIGNIVGFVANICAYPDAGKAFVVSVNTDSEGADYGRVYEALTAELAVPPPAAPTVQAPAADLAAWQGWYVLAPVRFETFAYLDTLFGAVHATWHDDRLVLGSLQAPDRVLGSAGGYLLIASNRAAVSHVAMRDADGARLISDGYSTYREIPLYRLVLLWLSLAAGLAGLLWFFGAGLVALVRHRGRAWRRAEMLPFLGVLALLAPWPLFLAQSFMALGDATPASVSLAIATGMLPLFMLAGVWRMARARQGARVHLVLAVCVLQWCAVLAAWGLLPLRLWM